MNKSINTNNKAFQSNGNVNKAQQLRQQKQKKLDYNNRNGSRPLEKSADSWQNSMDQIRRIAKKNPESSQIFDNPFTENDDRSEIDNAFQQNRAYSHMSTSYYEPPPPRHFNRQMMPPNHYYNDYNRPLSMYANSMNGYYPQRTVSNIDYENNSYRPPNYQRPINVNSNNIQSYASQPMGMRYYNPATHINRNRQPWLSPPNNFNSSNSMINPYQQNMVQNPYMPRVPAPNYYGYNVMPQYPSAVPVQPTNSNNATDVIYSMESMKKYVSTLMDKLDFLNKTIDKLKKESTERNNCCNHNCCNNKNNFQQTNNGHYCQSIPSNNNNRFSCNCVEQHNCHNRSQSSLSYNHRMCHNHNNYSISPRPHHNQHYNHNNCHSMTNNNLPNHHIRSHSSHCSSAQHRKMGRNFLPPLRSTNSSNQIFECGNNNGQLTNIYQKPNTNNSSQVASIEHVDIISSHFDELPVTPIDVVPL